ncbi:hypothetical protein CHLRE_03g159900v5 [Chlamydomonas reinhardtii]|uniref:non-specific serine/threonine protein kinase n=1 Tax=Chlamydomonas reinhardtii TaxID=3055 RepID=A0A2K3DWC2_CHLRE|nr:uncharacterized protein CHLRE_03g159900v5 [Chlamydomonas reinhardtii]PNW84824.1 hypothetical protein CHLRE_03g159900v5 [Chlamydomonas reinhardtii]
MGYDFLAIRALVSRGHISGVGRQIGVGKESDIFEVTNDDGEVFALKLHRLGRTSFRAVKSKRDYLGRRQNYSWLYLSRLAALKEFAFMKALYDHGFPVPQAIDNNRHAVLMSLVNARPMVQIREMAHPARVYLSCMELIGRLAGKGLIHCDFNEFNLLIGEDEELTLIDFPQMVSVTHANAEELFVRDVECIVRFFSKKIGYVPEMDPALPYVRPVFAEVAAGADAEGALDVELEASGFQRQHAKALDEYLATAKDEEEGEEEGEDDEEEDEDEESEEGEEGAAASGRGADGEGAGPGPEGEVLDAEGGSDVDERLKAVATRSRAAATRNKDGEGEGSEAGSEDGEGEDEEGEEGEGEERPPRRAGPRAGRHGGPGGGGRRTQRMGEAEVQAIVSAQRKKQYQKASMHRATRNSTKNNKGKKGKSTADDGW